MSDRERLFEIVSEWDTVQLISYIESLQERVDDQREIITELRKLYRSKVRKLERLKDNGQRGG